MKYIFMQQPKQMSGISKIETNPNCQKYNKAIADPAIIVTQFEIRFSTANVNMLLTYLALEAYLKAHFPPEF